MITQLTLIKKDHIVYPGGELISINTENIKYMFNGPDPGTINILYYDEQSAKLSYLITSPYTASVYGLAGLLSQPMVTYINQIDASNVKKPAILNRVNSAYEVSAGGGNTAVFYNNGRWNSQRNKRINVDYYQSVSTLNTNAITAVNQGLKRFSVGASIVLVAGDVIMVDGSTGNDGLYTVVSCTTGATSLIFVKEPIVDATVDGNVVCQ